MGEIRGIPFVHVMGSEDPMEHHGIVTFTIDGVHPHDVAAILDADHIAVQRGTSLCTASDAAYECQFLHQSQSDVL